MSSPGSSVTPARGGFTKTFRRDPDTGAITCCTCRCLRFTVTISGAPPPGTQTGQSDPSEMDLWTQIVDLNRDYVFDAMYRSFQEESGDGGRVFKVCQYQQNTAHLENYAQGDLGPTVGIWSIVAWLAQFEATVTDDVVGAPGAVSWSFNILPFRADSPVISFGASESLLTGGLALPATQTVNFSIATVLDEIETDWPVTATLLIEDVAGACPERGQCACCSVLHYVAENTQADGTPVTDTNDLIANVLTDEEDRICVWAPAGGDFSMSPYDTPTTLYSLSTSAGFAFIPVAGGGSGGSGSADGALPCPAVGTFGLYYNGIGEPSGSPRGTVMLSCVPSGSGSTSSPPVSSTASSPTPSSSGTPSSSSPASSAASSTPASSATSSSTPVSSGGTSSGGASSGGGSATDCTTCARTINAALSGGVTPCNISTSGAMTHPGGCTYILGSLVLTATGGGNYSGSFVVGACGTRTFTGIPQDAGGCPAPGTYLDTTAVYTLTLS